MNPMVPGLVSTIIPVYNRPAMLRRAVQSVLSQTYRPVEVVVADDGSTDRETARVGRELEASQPQCVRYCVQANGGPGVARNLGRAHARGEFIQYLDSDDTLLPEKFARQVADLEAHPECGVSYCVTHRLDAAGRTKVSHRTDQRFDTILPYCLERRIWHTVAPLWRRRVCDAVGPWSALRVMEDWEYDIRAGILGVKVWHTPEVLCLVHDHAEERASFVTVNDPEAVYVDYFRSYQMVFDHLKKANLTHYLEAVRFPADMFRLARGFALNGRVDLARQTCRVSQAVSSSRLHRAKVTLYVALASVLGWQRTTVLLERVWATVKRAHSAPTPEPPCEQGNKCSPPGTVRPAASAARSK
jgi:glycosyltransferase involved in cell wall biosynthesis